MNSHDVRHDCTGDCIDIKELANVLKKQWRVFVWALSFIWAVVVLAFFIVPREYEASYDIRLHGTESLATAKALLDANHTKIEALHKAGIEGNLDWHAKQISVKTIRQTGAIHVSVRAKSPEDAATIASNLLQEQRTAINRLNETQLTRTIDFQKNVEAARQKVLQATGNDRELALIEYGAVQQAFQQGQMKNLQVSISIMELDNSANRGNVAFPKLQSFFMAAFACSFTCILLMGMFFWYKNSAQGKHEEQRS